MDDMSRGTRLMRGRTPGFTENEKQGPTAAPGRMRVIWLRNSDYPLLPPLLTWDFLCDATCFEL